AFCPHLQNSTTPRLAAQQRKNFEFEISNLDGICSFRSPQFPLVKRSFQVTTLSSWSIFSVASSTLGEWTLSSLGSMIDRGLLECCEDPARRTYKCGRAFFRYVGW